jgi:uncharacterized protein (DUF302 family)
MQAAPLAALDLPLNVLVWLDEHQTKVTYTVPHALAARYGLSEDLGNRLAESTRSPTRSSTADAARRIRSAIRFIVAP